MGDTLYFYVDDSDLHELAPLLRRRFADFLEARTWVASEAWLVDPLHEDTEELRPGDLPDWDLGLNLRLAAPPEARPADWFEDVAAVVAFLRKLSEETGRAFVLGASFEGSRPEDLFDVDARPVDLEQERGDGFAPRPACVSRRGPEPPCRPYAAGRGNRRSSGSTQRTTRRGRLR
jgi:hypothetical protein